MDQAYDGGCLCGEVRWHATGEPLRVNYCHCEMCRRASGAPVVSWATFPAANVTFTRGGPTWRQSSDIAERGFCGTCGSALTWHGLGEDIIDVTVGTCDLPDTLVPSHHLWTESAIEWLDIPDNLPRYPRERSS
jgi:hypothetical protein